MSHHKTIPIGPPPDNQKKTKQNIMGQIMDVHVTGCYVTRRGSEGGRRRCKNCGGAFVPVGKQQFCTHGCYSASIRVAIEDRFWSKVNRRGPDDCWLWLASLCQGYGQIAGTVDGKRRPVSAHRVAWELTHGAIPEGLSVLHRCDNPPCVNPAHLFIGTQPDNLSDARRKGRLIDGLGARKLSDDAYLHILSEPRDRGTGVALARRYGVDEVTISRIRNGRQGSTYRNAHAESASNVERVPFVQLAIRGEVA